MARLVLHIGTAKTGSTFIQDYLVANQQALADLNWIVPDFVPTANKTLFAAALGADNVNRHYGFTGLATEDARAVAQEKLAQSIDERFSSDQTWLISSENFSGMMLTPPLILGVREYFQRWFDDIQVVVYFRRQDYMLVSVFSEHYKHLGLHQPLVPLRSPDWDWFQKHHRGMTTNHLGKLNLWANVFGEDNVAALPYSDSRKSGNAILDSFRGATGLPDGPTLVTPERTSTNLSLSARGIGFVYRTLRDAPNLFADLTQTTFDDPLEQRISDAVRPFVRNHKQRPEVRLREQPPGFDWRSFDEVAVSFTKGPPVTPTAETLGRIMDFYQEDNRELAKRGSGTEWQEWLDQPVRQSGENEIVLPGDDEFIELLNKVAARGQEMVEERRAAAARRRPSGARPSVTSRGHVTKRVLRRLGISNKRK